MTTPHTVCPGPCNRIWREGSPISTTQPRYGSPVWCRRDTNIVLYCLSELPGLLALIRDDALHGTTARSGARPTGHSAPWPGQTAMLTTDAVAEVLTGLEDDTRRLRRFSAREANPSQTGTIRAAIGFLTANSDWLLTEHPEAALPETSPGTAILRLHWKVQRIAKADPQRPKRADIDCPSCKYRALALAPGDDSYECAMCGRRLRLSEYEEYVKEAAAALA